MHTCIHVVVFYYHDLFKSINCHKNTSRVHSFEFKNRLIRMCKIDNNFSDNGFENVSIATSVAIEGPAAVQ